MTSTYSQEPEGGSSAANCSGTDASGPSRSTHTAAESSSSDNATESSSPSPSSTTSEPLTGDRGAGESMLCAGGSHAKTSAAPESERDSTASARASGGRCTESFAKWSHDSSSWRTSQLSLFGGSIEFSDRWPTSGSMRSGACFRQRNAGPLTFGNGFGCLLPTPTKTVGGWNKSQGKNAKRRYSLGSMARSNRWPTPTVDDAHNITRKSGAFQSLTRAVMLPTPTATANMLSPSMQKWPAHRRIWTTPTAHNAKETNAPSESERNTPTLAAQAGGSLNPAWVEWLMGWPIGWTDLQPLATDRFQQWQQLHSGS